MTAYKVQYNGTAQDVEAMIRITDKYFRKYYNVHGGKREASYTDERGYHVVMSYQACWVGNGYWVGFEEILKASYRRVYRMKWVSDDSYMEMRH